ncbi:MAG: phosphoribosyltransferase family protein [Acidimicrobiales bacterium]
MFCDRTDAGKQLAQRLHHLHGDDVVVVGLPRGGVPVAAEVADALDAPLDVVIVRKLGVPFQPELAMGAIGEGGIRVLNQDIIERTETNATELRTIEDREARRTRTTSSPLPIGCAGDPARGQGGDRRRRWHRHGIDRLGGLPDRASPRCERVVLAVPVAPPIGSTDWPASQTR